MNPKIKGVFFDLYGTLLIFNDIEQSWLDWAETFYSLIKGKTNLSFQEFSKRSDSFLSRKVVKDLSLGLTTYETRIKNHCESLNIQISEAELKTIADETPHAWQKYISVAGNAHIVLSELKQTKTLALISNFDHAPHVKKTLKHFDLEKYFDLVIISDEINCSKPDPKIFEEALAKTNLTPEEVVFVGDNVNDDIAGARAANIQPILIMHDTFTTQHDYSHGERQKSNKTFSDVRVINSLTELLKL